MSETDLDLLTDDEWDAELIIEYLTASREPAGPDTLDLGPPGSARQDLELAGDNEAAWAIVKDDPRYKALGLKPLDARQIATGQPVSRSVAFQERLHPRDAEGKWARKPGGALAAEVAASPEGFSLDPATGRPPTGGYMVAMDVPTSVVPASVLNDEQALATELDKMIMANQDAFAEPGTYLGGWVHEGKLYLEPSQNIASLAEATRLARERDQIALYDVAGGQEIPTGGSGGEVAARTQGVHGAGAAGLREAPGGGAPQDRAGTGAATPRGPEPGERAAGLRRWDPKLHPRDPGGKGGGQFVKAGAVGGGSGPEDLYAAVTAFAQQARQSGLHDDVADRLDWAARVMERGDRAGFDQAERYIRNAARSPQASAGVRQRLLDLAGKFADVEPAPPPGPPRTVQALTRKGAEIVPGLLGGGRQVWNGEIRTAPVLQMDPDTLADLDWDQHIDYTDDVAAGLNADLGKAGEPLYRVNNLVVPLHELIHGVIGGHEAEREKRREGFTDLTADDEHVLAVFHNTDMDTSDRQTHAHTLAQLNESQPPRYQITQAQIDSLTRRGYLDKAPFSDFADAGAVHYWALSAKGEDANVAPPGEGAGPERFAESRDPYQNPAVQAIEEGFTELGTIQHAAGFFDALGIGDRPTGAALIDAGHAVDSPEFKRRQAALFGALGDEAAEIHNTRFHGPPQPGRLNDDDQLARLEKAMARAANDLSQGDLDGVGEELWKLQHSGDPVYVKDARRLIGQMEQLSLTPELKPATLRQVAARRADPQAIANGNGYGHYPDWTQLAQRWVQEVALAEGRGGAALRKRMTELADEINRESAQRKVAAMTRQVLRTVGGKHQVTRPGAPDFTSPDAIGRLILQGWLTRGGWRQLFSTAQAAAGGGDKR